MSAIPALIRLRKEDCEFQASLGYTAVSEAPAHSGLHSKTIVSTTQTTTKKERFMSFFPVIYLDMCLNKTSCT
jgi:isopentenyl phosphate kinase